VDEVFVALVDVLRATARAGVDRVDDDVEDRLAEERRPGRFRHQHGEIEERPEIENSQPGSPVDDPEISFGIIGGRNR
jgi:hypothetical protein